MLGQNKPRAEEATTWQTGQFLEGWPTTEPRAQVLCQYSLLRGSSLPPLGLPPPADQMVAILKT